MIKLTKHNSFADSLFPSFPNFTEAMYEGNKPAGKGHEHIEGGYCDRWSCKWGGGESYKGRLLNADFKPNYKITIYICGDVLWITDLRHSGKTDVWEYCLPLIEEFRELFHKYGLYWEFGNSWNLSAAKEWEE